MSDGYAHPTQAIEAKTGPSHLFYLVLLTSLSLLNFGYNTASIGGALLYIDQESVDCQHESVCLATSFEKGAVVSSCLLGACLGALAAGSLADLFGRRFVLLANNIFYVLGPIGMATAASVEVLAATRALTGVGVGVASALVHVYIGENVPASRRGEYGAILVMMGTGGILLANISSYILGDQWRAVLAIGAVPGLFQLCFGWRVMPESPCWLRDRELRRQRASGGKMVAHDLEAIISDSLFEDETGGGWTALWRAIASGKAAQPLFVGAGLQFLQQVSGINVAVYYGPKIFTLAGFSKDVATFLCVCLSATQMAATLLLARVIDRLGRRPVSLVGIGFMAVSLVALAAAFVPGLLPSDAAATLSVVAMLLFRVSFSISLGPLPFIITAEIFPSSCRTTGVSLCWFVNWVSNFAMSLAFLPMLQVLDAYGTFLLCAGICMVALLFVLVCVPETRGQHAEAPVSSGREAKQSEAGKSEASRRPPVVQRLWSFLFFERCSRRKLLHLDRDS